MKTQQVFAKAKRSRSQAAVERVQSPACLEHCEQAQDHGETGLSLNECTQMGKQGRGVKGLSLRTESGNISTFFFTIDGERLEIL